MSTEERPSKTRKPVVVRPAQGRRYDMGRMRATFLADGQETDSRYSISEWWLKPRTCGPGTHSHEDDHIYYVLAGTVSIFIDGEWTDATRGCCAVIPGGTPHNFENRSYEECGFISINTPGGFEEEMPAIVQWFAERPLGDVADA
jgi:mannose-6-phosphate isomerase-like protein (cupin superfamily)